jgi:hypothetical protein
MAIDLGTSTLTIQESRRTWRVNIESPLNQPPFVQIYRELVKVPSAGEPTTYPDLTPLTVPGGDLSALAAWAEIPPEYAAYFPDKAALGKFLKLLPLAVSLACDAAEREHSAK